MLSKKELQDIKKEWDNLSQADYFPNPVDEHVIGNPFADSLEQIKSKDLVWEEPVQSILETDDIFVLAMENPLLAEETPYPEHILFVVRSDEDKVRIYDFDIFMSRVVRDIYDRDMILMCEYDKQHGAKFWKMLMEKLGYSRLHSAVNLFWQIYMGVDPETKEKYNKVGEPFERLKEKIAYKTVRPTSSVSVTNEYSSGISPSTRDLMSRIIKKKAELLKGQGNSAK